MRSAPRPTSVRRALVKRKLRQANVPSNLAEQVSATLPDSAIAVMLYGSRARGDVHSHSDVDILVVSTKPSKTVSAGRVSSSTYSALQFSAAHGTLFGAHLARDAKILHDTESWAQTVLSDFPPPDFETIRHRVRRIAVALKSDGVSLSRYLPGLVRLGRYLLRTALYAERFRIGRPSFSVDEIARDLELPALRTLLSSHPEVHGEATLESLDHIIELLEQTLGPIEQNPFLSLEALIVGTWYSDADTANASLLALGAGRSDLPYAEIPRIVL